METFFTLLTLFEGNPQVAGGFPLQTPATRSFNIFFDLCMNKRFSKQSKRRRFEAPPSILWRHCTLVAISSQKRMQLANWNADHTSSNKMVEKISRDFETLTELLITNFFMLCLLSRSYHILVFMLYMTMVSPTGISIANVIKCMKCIGRMHFVPQGYCYHIDKESMMASSNGNIFRVTGPLCGEFTGLRWIPHTKASDAWLWCFLWSATE